ncbi:MAG TPA: multicopper oxidase domain-containing protein [Actinomycetota bacterium]|nr:multicopper oxidase domain-containing protein [Actinomycetota bacterium]
MVVPRLTRTLTILASLGLVLTACVAQEATPAIGSDEAGGSASISVTLSEFSIEPSSLRADVGSVLSIEVANHGSAPHTFAVVTDGETYETPTIQPGGHETLSVPPLDAGSYDVLCTVPGHDALGMTGTLTVGGAPAAEPGAGTTDHGSMTAEEMAAGHEAGVKAFLAGDQTEVRGGQPLAPTLDGEVKVFDLEVTQAWWEVEKGVVKEALAYNGQIPGPEIRVRPGDRVRFHLRNSTDQPTVLHFHGVTLPNAMDGVPYITQDPVMPGESFDYEFEVVDPPGMYVYHSHFNSAEQVGRGLYGALIVEPPDGTWRRTYGVEPEREYSLFLGDGPLGFVLNGKSFPATLPLVASRGETMLIHLANDGELLHPMHLHGFHFRVVGVDGFPLAPANRYLADTLVVAPGSRYDILVEASAPGAWAFHCHILSHVEGPEGMFGMVTAVVVG